MFLIAYNKKESWTHKQYLSTFTHDSEKILVFRNMWEKFENEVFSYQLIQLSGESWVSRPVF